MQALQLLQAAAWSAVQALQHSAPKRNKSLANLASSAVLQGREYAYEMPGDPRCIVA